MNDNIDLENINIKDSNIKPVMTFRRLCYLHMQQLTNFPYIEKDFDALTDYELLCLVVKYLNDVINNSNKQNESITNLYNAFLQLQNYINESVQELEDEWNDKTTELENAFNELNDYVRDYFANLDVQDEINNKLDEMLEDGVLTEIIGQFLQSTAIWCFDTVADMQSATNLINGSYAKTLGYYSINDGGEAIYKITNSVNSNEFQVEISNSLYATLIIDDEINVLQTGCKINDNTFNNHDLLNKAFNYKNTDVYIPEGIYYINGQITALKSKKIHGNGTLLFTNATENGLIVGDSIQLEGIEINATGDFIGTVLKYDGEIGERTYPSTATFKNLVISSNTTYQIDCIFDFNPWRNYGIVIENIKIGKQGDSRLSSYGFKCDINAWANNMNINEMIIDIMGNNIIPFYLNNQTNIQNSYWNIQSLIIQARQATYTYFSYIHGFSNITIVNSHIYDKGEGTFDANNNIIYDKCAYVSVIGSLDFRLINSTITNPVSSNASFEGYNTENLNGSSLNTLNDIFNLTSYTDKIVPILFPHSNIITNRTEIEISTRYSGTCYGNILKLISTACSNAASSFSNRNILLIANKYRVNPLIYKIETVYEGTIVWIKGGFNIHYFATCWNKPKIAINETVHVIGDGTAKVLNNIDITESTQYLQATTYPLYFWGVKEIDNSTFNQGT